jgi:cytochrome c553
MTQIFLRKTSRKKIPGFVFLCSCIALLLLIQTNSVGAQQDTATAQKDSAVVAQKDTVTDSQLDAAPVAQKDTGMIKDTVRSAQAGDSAVSSQDKTISFLGHSSEAIKRGERFFLGILPFEREHASCVSCHNLKRTDTLNWNPSAHDIALRYATVDFAAFQQALMQPAGIKMSASHQNFNFSEEDLKTIKEYLDDLAVKGPPTEKPTLNELLLFLFLGLIITWALLDLIFFHKIKYKIITVIIFLGAFSYQVVMIYEEAVKLGRSQDYQPDQPIKFSHQVHATENQIDCMFCHHTAENSKTANIPSTNLCMNCHIVVREGTRSGTFEIDKLVDAYEEGRSIEWIRIHELPDHVFFSHAQHVGAGKLDCAQCHGKVEAMHVVRQESDLSMGWCIDCHRQTKVNFLENDYYTIFEEFHENLKKGIMDSVVAADIGANECQKCHY